MRPIADTASAPSRNTYERWAPLYDALEWIPERAAYARWRPMLFDGMRPGSLVLELGVGTGRNLCHHPRDSETVSIDSSPRMLREAARKVGDSPATLLEADAERLPFRFGIFDFVVASFVFCSVAEPRRALAEARRALKVQGELRLIEHALTGRRAVDAALKLATPVTRIFGCRMDRRTPEEVRAAGFRVVEERALGRGGVFGFTRALKGGPPQP